VTVSGGQVVQFEVTPGTYNLSRSYLSFNALAPNLNTKYNWMYMEGMPMIREILVQGKNNSAKICEVRMLNKYLKTILRREMQIDEVRALDCITMTNATPTAASGSFEGLSMGTGSDDRPNNVTRQLGVSGTTGNPEPAYMAVSAQGGTGGTVTQGIAQVNFHLPLGLIKNTILAADKSIYWSETLYIRITFDGANSWYFTGDGAADPSDAPVAPASSIAISALQLFLCQEDNPMIQQRLMDVVTNGAGLTLPLDTVDSTVMSISGAGTHYVNLSYSSTLGSKLKKVYWSPFSSADNTLNTYYDNNNTAAAKVSSFYITLDSNRINRNDYNTARGDDFQEVRNKLKGSCISTQNQYYYNFAYALDLSSPYNLLDQPLNPPKENFRDGLSLDSERKITVVCTAAATLNHYAFGVVQRSITIGKQGVVIGN
jgi:hypothetical protein